MLKTDRLNIRLSKAERTEFNNLLRENQAEGEKKTPASTFAKAKIFNTTKVLEPELFTLLEKINKEINSSGVNLNQIARHLNRKSKSTIDQTSATDFVGIINSIKEIKKDIQIIKGNLGL